MHNPCILVGHVEVGVEAAYYVAGADISVAHVDRYLCHDILSKNFGKCRITRATYMAIEGVYRFSVMGLKKSGEASCVTFCAQSSPCQGNTKGVQALTNSSHDH